MTALNMTRASALTGVAVAMVLGGTSLANTLTPVGPTSATSQTTRGLSDYRLGVGDKLRILTFDEPNLSGEFTVNTDGAISFPLIGDVKAVNLTADQVAASITRELAAGYLRAPRVSIDVLEYRPVYILGEVNKPGEYPYAPGMTVMTAVATANGFTYRADQKHVYIKTPNQTTASRVRLVDTIQVKPGDVIRIGERYF
jgi:polysaccharide export outer membrane protein